MCRAGTILDKSNTPTLSPLTLLRLIKHLEEREGIGRAPCHPSWGSVVDMQYLSSSPSYAEARRPPIQPMSGSLLPRPAGIELPFQGFKENTAPSGANGATLKR